MSKQDLPPEFTVYAGREAARQQLQNWLVKFQSPENTKGACIISGGIGLGKTTLAKSLLKEYRVILVTPSQLPARKNVDQFFHDHILSANLMDMWKQTSRPLAVVVDGIEDLGLKQKACFLKFLSWVYPSKKKNKRALAIKHNVPFFFIGRHTHIKIIQTAIKHCVHVKLKPPEQDEQVSMIREYLRRKGVKVVRAGAEELIEFAQSDIRQLGLMCHEFVLTGVRVLTQPAARAFLRQYCQVEAKFGVIWSTAEVLTGSVDFNTAFQIYQQDKYLLPLMIHENYPRLLARRDRQLTQSIANLLVNFDIYDTHMYRNQSWYMQEMCGVLVCAGVSTIVNDHEAPSNTDALDTSCMKFTCHLNRTSIVTVRRKQFTKLATKTGIHTREGMYYLKLLHLAGCDMKPYGIDEEDHACLSKVDLVPMSKKKRNKTKAT